MIQTLKGLINGFGGGSEFVDEYEVPCLNEVSTIPLMTAGTCMVTKTCFFPF